MRMLRTPAHRLRHQLLGLIVTETLTRSRHQLNLHRVAVAFEDRVLQRSERGASHCKLTQVITDEPVWSK
jgi:hypothetical protein